MKKSKNESTLKIIFNHVHYITAYGKATIRSMGARAARYKTRKLARLLNTSTDLREITEYHKREDARKHNIKASLTEELARWRQ